MDLTLGIPDECLPAVFDLLARLADAFVATLGPTAEIVVHDLRHPDASVVAIAGSLTGRQVGSPIPDPEFLPEHLRDITDDQRCYPTRAAHGRTLNSSTIFIRDRGGRITGAICINVDQNDLVEARELIARVLGAAGRPAAPAPVLTTFASDLDQLVTLALDGIGERLGRPRHQFTREDRIEAIRELDRMGVFQLRNAAVVVATELGVSRASVFNYLREARGDGAVEPALRRELAWLG
jgi:predicted transcriptional regulator YheO